MIAPKRSKRRKHTPPEFGSPEDVISREVLGLLGHRVVARAEADGVEWVSPFGFREEVELTESSISSSGMSCFKVRERGRYSYHPLYFYLHWKRPDLNRSTCHLAIVRASMGRRRSLHVTWRSCSRSSVQACKDVLFCGPHQYRSYKPGTARRQSMFSASALRHAPDASTRYASFQVSCYGSSPCLPSTPGCSLTRPSSASNAALL